MPVTFSKSSPANPAKRRKQLPRSAAPAPSVEHGAGTVEGDAGVVAKDGSEAILKYCKVFIPMGAPICRAHQQEVEQLVERLHNKERVESAGSSYKASSKGSAGASSGGSQQPPPPSAEEQLWREILPEAEQLVRKLAGLFKTPLNIMGQDWTDASSAQRDRKAREFGKFVQYLSRVVHKRQYGDEAMNYVMRRLAAKVKVEEDSPLMVAFLNNVAVMYSNARTPVEKRTALSLIADEVTFAKIQAVIPNLSPYMFSEARRFRRLFGPGGRIRERKINQQRWNPVKVEYFVDYITRSDSGVVMDLPYGWKEIRFDTGEPLQIPNLLRLMDDTRIIYAYEAHLEEEGLEDLKMSHSTYRRILHRCRASRRRRVAGLDYILHAVLEKLDTVLEEVLPSLAPSSLPGAKRPAGDEPNADIMGFTSYTEWEKDFRTGKNYLRANNRLHCRIASQVPDHCIKYALSDPADRDFQSPCEDHRHESRCADCENAKSMIFRLNDFVDAVPDPAIREKLNHILIQTDAAVKKFKSHTIRIANQNRAKSDLLDNLKPDTEALIIVDWAMKLLPTYSRERQTDFFAQRGMNWLIFTVLMSFEGEGQIDLEHTGGVKAEFMERTYIYFLETPNSQDGSAVAAIADHLIGFLKRGALLLNTVYFRSDKAYCFHNARLFRRMQEMEAKHGVTVKRWDFSEPQSGKSSCDRAAGRAKAVIKAATDSGKDCATPTEVIECLRYGKGVKNSIIFLGEVSGEKPPQFSIPGILSWNNFEFSPAGLRAWRAYGIGPGRRFAWGRWSGKFYQNTFQVASEPGKPDQPAILWESKYESEARHSTWQNPGFPGVWDFWNPIDVDVSRAAQDRRDQEAIEFHRKFRASLDRAEGETAECEPADQDTCPVSEEPLTRQEELESTKIFHCPELGCTAVFAKYGNLQRHLDAGNHRYRLDRESLLDAAAHEYVARIQARGLEPVPLRGEGNIKLLSEEELAAEENKLSMGWALPPPIVRGKRTPEQQQFVADLWTQGELTGKKMSARMAAKRMRESLPPALWLDETQIKNVFSSMTSDFKKGKIKVLDKKEAAKRAGETIKATEWSGETEPDSELAEQLDLHELTQEAMQAAEEAERRGPLH